jgi:hypothetical protein
VFSETHGRRCDHALVGDDVLNDAFAPERDPRERRSWAKPVKSALAAANAKIHFKLLHFMGIALGEPASFLSWIGEGCEEALGRIWVTVFNNEGAVDNRGFH